MSTVFGLLDGSFVEISVIHSSLRGQGESFLVTDSIEHPDGSVEINAIHSSLRSQGESFLVIDGIEHPNGFWFALFFSALCRTGLLLYMREPITDPHYAQLVGGTDLNAVLSFFDAAPGFPVVLASAEGPPSKPELKYYVENYHCVISPSVSTDDELCEQLPLFWKSAVQMSKFVQQWGTPSRAYFRP